jgi:hypothetical protein|tara:strand:+ start:467 stop:664 length:198 start_codon:yes stop_codon:yes gene_type:complete
MNKDTKYTLELIRKDKQISELYVLIDTLQTNLRSSVSRIKEEDRGEITSVQSYKWCMNWKQGDEK